jgi:hypothetical protein
MLFSALISVTIGIVLARQFKVLILAPIFMLTLVLAIGAGLMHTSAAWFGPVDRAQIHLRTRCLSGRDIRLRSEDKFKMDTHRSQLVR